MNYDKKSQFGSNDSKSQKNNSVGTYAAALQDHLLRNVNLLIPAKNNKLQPTKQSKGQKVLTKSGRVINLDPNKLQANATKQLITKTGENKGVLKDLENALKRAEVNEHKNIQAKLYTYIKKLTLAQRLGLVEKPPKPLSNDEWTHIEEINKKREDNNTCPICLEGFKTPNNQTILSCSHVFHKTCLANFEKFTKSRVCPICRRQDYEKKNFDQGFITYLTVQVIKLQKFIRGFIIRRKFYLGLQKNGYKATSTLLKRRLLGFKLQLLNEKMTKKVRTRQKETEKLFVEIDKNLDDKNNFNSKLLEIQNIQKQTMENLQAVIPDLVQRKTTITSLSDHTSLENELSKKWREIHKVAVLRNEKSCAICFNDLNNGKKLYLLNCTHLFHCACLVSFEYYSIYTQHSCPVCRSEYEKIEINHW